MKKLERFDIMAAVGLFVFSITTRLFFVFSAHGEIMPPDGVLYSNIACHLIEGKGFLQDVRNYFIVVPPIYPAFLSLIYLIFGIGNTSAVLVFHAIIGASTVVYIYKTAKILFNRWVGLSAGILFSIYSVSIYFTGLVLTETIFTFLVVVLTYYIVILLQPKSRYWTACTVGVIWGIACLTRPHFLLFVPFLWLLLFIKKRLLGIKFSAVTTLLLIITIMPWLGYTYKLYDCFIPISSHGGLNLWLGNSSFTNPNEYYNSKLYAEVPQFIEQRKEAELLPSCDQDQYFRDSALRYIKSHPSVFVVNTLKKLYVFLKPVGYSSLQNLTLLPLVKIINVTDPGLLILALPGLYLAFLTKWDFKKNQILLWLFLYYSLMVSSNVVVSQGRYRLPVMPLVAIYGGLSVSEFVRVMIRWSKRAAQSVKKVAGNEK